MSFQKPYSNAYKLIVVVLFALNFYFYLESESQFHAEYSTFIYSYFSIKIFLLIGNLSLPFKYFHYNKIIFQSLIGLTFGLLIFFSLLELYNNAIMVILDCALCLLSVFSLMKMHQNRNASKNNI